MVWVIRTYIVIALHQILQAPSLQLYNIISTNTKDDNYNTDRNPPSYSLCSSLLSY
jgi:hypothetical protein